MDNYAGILLADLAEQHTWAAEDRVVVQLKYIQRQDDAEFIKFLQAYPAALPDLGNSSPAFTTYQQSYDAGIL